MALRCWHSLSSLEQLRLFGTSTYDVSVDYLTYSNVENVRNDPKMNEPTRNRPIIETAPPTFVPCWFSPCQFRVTGTPVISIDFKHLQLLLF